MPSSLWQILVQNSEIARYNFPAIAFLAMLVVSIILEAAVAVVAVLAARRRNPYIYGLAFTFGAYVLYDSPAFSSGMFREAFFPGSSCWRPLPR
jgi:hypothetical protein